MIARLAILLIRVYQWTLSPLLGPVCRFTPSCSRYAVTCLERFGFLRGSWLAIKRIGRCHPWHPGGYDPPPLPDGARNQSSIAPPGEPSRAGRGPDGDRETPGRQPR